jgi:hypothetical protein
MMEAGAENGVAVSLYDKETRKRVSLAVSDNNLPVIGVLGKNGKAAISLAVSDKSGWPHLVIHDRAGNPRTNLTVDVEGTPHVYRYYNRWRARWRALGRFFADRLNWRRSFTVRRVDSPTGMPYAVILQDNNRWYHTTCQVQSPPQEPLHVGDVVRVINRTANEVLVERTTDNFLDYHQYLLCNWLQIFEEDV